MSIKAIAHSCGHVVSYDGMPEDLTVEMEHAKCYECSWKTFQELVPNVEKTPKMQFGILDNVRIIVASFIIGNKLWNKLTEERNVLIKWLSGKK